MSLYDNSVDYNNRGVQHPNPLYDYLTTFAPRKLKTLFHYCEYLYYNSTHVYAAINKFSTYPLTNFIYHTNGNDKVKEKYTNLAEEEIKLMEFLGHVSKDQDIYGNSFVSVYFPIVRYLHCDTCSQRYNIKHIDYDFKIANRSFTFKARCEKCNSMQKMTPKDESVKDPSRIKLIRWSPHHMEVEYNEITGESDYYYTIPTEMAEKIRQGDRTYIDTMPLAFLETVARKEIFRFSNNHILHTKRDAPAGLPNRWGMPLLIAALKQFYYTAVLRKANEAIGLEYVMPFRVLHPQQGTAAADPTTTISMANWMEQTKANLKSWRRDPLHLMFSPVPVGVTNVGGQGRALMVTGEIVEAENSLIASMGIPKEFIYGGLSATGGGVTLRMLENQLLSRKNDLVKVGQWIVSKIGDFMGWPSMRIDMVEFKLVDDAQQKMALMQANMESGGTLLSQTSIARIYDRDLAEERVLRKKETLDEARFQHELNRELEKQTQSLVEQAQAAAGSEQPLGYDTQAVIANADKIVQQISQMPEGARKSFLVQLEDEDFVMYSVVLKRLEVMRTQEEAMMRSQMRQQQGPMM